MNIRTNKFISYIFAAFILAFVVFLNPLIARAEGNSKSVNLTLSKDYKVAEVTLTFESAGIYEATITDEGEKHTFTFGVVDSTTMTCQMDKPKAGTWTLTVTSEGSIPKFTASLSGTADDTTSAVSSNISVGKDIVGLKVYFKDNILVAEWTDDTVGNVNVRVSNLDNSEQIAKETVTGQYFEVEIPETVKNITVGIVPSSSSNVTGAEQVFTFVVPEYPSGVTVELPTAEYINSTEITANVSIDDTYSFLVEVNGSKTYESASNDAGEYEVPVSMSATEGEENVVVYVVDAEGNMFSTKKTYILDLTSPELTLTGDYSNLSTYEDKIGFYGTIKDFDTFTINDESITPASDGTWSYMASLHLGENSVHLLASDVAGNTAEYDFVVNMVEQQKDYSKLIVSIVFFTVIIIVVVVIIIVKKNKDNPKKPKDKKIKKSNPIESLKEDKDSGIEKKEFTFRGKKITKKRAFKFFVDYILPILAIVYIFNVVLKVSVVSSGSMESTIMTGAFTIENRLAYKNHNVERGDIISFKHNGMYYGKRVIGISGDTIEFHDGDVYLNGELLEEDYLDFDTDTNCSKTFEVPEGKVFVLGDNREDSNDSRFWEEPYVDESDIVSKIILITPKILSDDLIDKIW